MAKIKGKDKLKKNLERYTDELVADYNAIGWKFEDPIINTKLRHVEAVGVAQGVGDVSALFTFNKKGTKVNSETLSISYDAFNGMMLQEYKYNNYKKFQKAIEGSHKKRYESIQGLLSNGSTMQKGVDLTERLPGVSDVNWYVWNYDTGDELAWL